MWYWARVLGVATSAPPVLRMVVIRLIPLDEIPFSDRLVVHPRNYDAAVRLAEVSRGQECKSGRAGQLNVTLLFS